MHTRLLVRLVVVAAAFSMAGLSSAMAEDDCKDAVSAEGKPATLRDLGAYPNSLLAWRSAVKEKYGSEYNSWRYAKDRDVVCDQKDDQWVCKRKAKPCKDVLHKMIDSAATAAKANCKDDSLSSYGAKKKEEDAAMEEAQSGWEIDTRKKYGKEWADWDNAANTDIDCHKVSGGHQCIAVATACMAK
jgi:hypothetical protein